MIKARLIRYTFAVHRWLGVALGLLMLLWCLSGVVMIWNPYPNIVQDGHDYRVEGLEPVVAPAAHALPDIPADAALSTARIEMLAGRAVLNLAWKQEEKLELGVFDVESGAPIKQVSEAEALAVGRTYAARHGIAGEPGILRLIERDEFMVAGYYNATRPFYQVALNDADRTVLYVSQKTGEVRQRTTASIRFWTWAGAIPHWLFFTELRKNGPLWTNIIIWTSLAGCFLTVIGLYVGLRQFRRRKSTGKRASPYSGAKFWHHMTGLVFGLLVLSFSFSGFASMQPWGWLDVGKPASDAAARYTGEPLSWAKARPAFDAHLTALRTGAGERAVVAYTQIEGEPWFVWQAADGARLRFDASGRPAPFDVAAGQRAAKALAGGEPSSIDMLTANDAYYYPAASAAGLPVLRVTVPAMNNTRFYLDPDTGELRYTADSGTKGFRWLHQGLHTFDVVGSPLREILLVLAMIGVTAVCGFGAWMGVRKVIPPARRP